MSRRAAERARDRVKANITAKDRVDTGAMRDAVKATHLRQTPTRSEWGVVVTGKPANYFIFQDQGTRAHGPVRAKVLRFKPKGSSTFVFAKRVRGITPGNFVRDAFRDTRREDFLP